MDAALSQYPANYFNSLSMAFEALHTFIYLDVDNAGKFKCPTDERLDVELNDNSSAPRTISVGFSGYWLSNYQCDLVNHV